MEFPKTLYVRERDVSPYVGIKEWYSTGYLEGAIPDNGQANVIAVYELVSIGSYKKTITKTSVVQKVSDGSDNS